MKRARNRTIELNGQNKIPLGTTAKNTKHFDFNIWQTWIAKKQCCFFLFLTCYYYASMGVPTVGPIRQTDDKRTINWIQESSIENWEL